MEEETVEYKMDVSDENIKRKAMKVIWEFSGVTLVDIKDKKILKVKGSKFREIDLGCELRTIDESVDIISRKAQQNYIPSVSSFFNYLYTPKEEIVIFEFEVLNELIKSQAMEVIWEFPGITSVEIKGGDQIIVKGGQINKLNMVTKLQKKIGNTNNVKIKWHGDRLEAEKSSNTGTSKGPIVLRPGLGEALANARQQHEAAEKAKAEQHQHEVAKKAKAEVPVTHSVMNKAMQVPKLSDKRSYKRRIKLLRCFCFR